MNARPDSFDTHHRTAVGNRIDWRLALGHARMTIRDIESDVMRSENRMGKVRISLRSEVGRKRTLRDLRKAYAPVDLGLTARDRHRTGCLAKLSVVKDTRRDDDKVNVCVLRTDLDLNAPRSAPPAYDRMSFDNRILVFASEHAMARYIQRSGDHTRDGFVDLMRRAGGWSSIAHYSPSCGQWAMPTETGMACFNMERTGRTPDGSLNVSVMATFMTTAEMRPRTLDIRQRLIDIGGLELTPRIATYRTPTTDQCKAWVAMREEGMQWESRRDYAKAKRAERSAMADGPS